MEFYGRFPTIASMVKKNFVIQGAFGKAERVTLVESIIGVVLNAQIFIERDDKALSDFLIRPFSMKTSTYGPEFTGISLSEDWIATSTFLGQWPDFM